MKKTLAVLVLVPFLMGCASCVSWMTSRGQSWEEMQAVGGLRVDDPATQPDGRIFLPVLCNVSGLETITVKPTMMNSALVVRKIDGRVRGGKIQIQVVTGLIDHRHTTRPKGVALGRLKKGVYPVEYRNPDGRTVAVRNVEIK